MTFPPHRTPRSSHDHEPPRAASSGVHKPSVAELVARLVAFGLDEAEARLYYELSSGGPSRAAEAAEAADMPRTQAYRELEDLHAKGFVEKTLERPMRFVAVPLETALQRAIERRQEEVQNLEQEQQRLAREWPDPSGSRDLDAERFAVHQGRAQVRGLLERLISSATQEIVVAAGPRGLFRLDIGWLTRQLAQRVRAGVAVRVLTRVDDSNREALLPLAEVAEVRHVELPSYHQMLVIDDREVALFVSGGRSWGAGSKEQTVLWVGAPSFALAQKALLDRVWQDGIAYAARSDQLLGKAVPEQVVLMRGRFVRYDRMKRRLHKAKRAIALAPGDEVRRWGKAGVTGLLEEAADAGGDVRVLSDDVAGGLPMRRFEGEDIPLVLVLDRREIVLCAAPHDGREGLTHEGEWSVWASSTRWGAYLDRMLQDAWDRSPPA